MAKDITIITEYERSERFRTTPSSFAQAGGLTVTQAGRYLLNPDTRRIFSANSTTFWVATRQDGMIIKNGQNYVLGKNNVWCVPSHSTLEYINNTDEPLETFFIGFNGAQADLLIRQSGMHEGYSELSHELFDCLLQCYTTILNTKHEPDTFTSELRRMEMLYKIFGLLCQCSESRTDHAELKRQTGWMEEAIDYIHAHYHKSITVNHVAEHVGIHRTHFSKQFHHMYKVPPAEYIRSLKMEKARRLLLETSDSLAEIAYAVGYPDVFSFSKAFKKYSSFTPKKYRLQLS
ncbi:helix-turn-helix transcriptional regulator [Paenibacillus wenxiniae]|uniref:Helix-turn-helix transcriptional regulator n=1 Tax=Paenibacillus wenxiniae TaxID=1636843 RepID=A0ABW4RNU3_9BACL